MAIPLIYDSCLTVEALDEAVHDFLYVQRYRAEIEDVINRGRDPLDEPGYDPNFLINQRGDNNWLDLEKQKLQDLKLAPF